MRIDRVCVGPLETNCWIVSDGLGVAVVIDPGDEPDAIMSAVGSERVGAILLTHCHFDHLGALVPLVGATGAPVMVHADDAEFIQTPQGTGGSMFGFENAVAPPPDRVLEDGQTVIVGALALEILSTPGHTPGSICVLVRDSIEGTSHLFSGDTLFAGSVGRTDFPRGDARALARSLARSLVGLPGDTVVHPGHGPETTVEREARVNPYWPRA